MSVRLTTLDNGLRVVSDAMDSVETTSLGVWIGAGARDEPAPHNGVAHMLEHMVFKGTERRDAQAIATEIEDVGGHLNAYTGREITGFYAKVLKEDVDLAFDVVGDLVRNAVLDLNEMERERSVVLQEIGQADDTPDDIVFDFFQAAAFPDQPMGRPVLGTAATVSALRRDDVFAYRGANYRPRRMIVAAAGRIDHDHLAEATRTLFGAPREGVRDDAAAAYRGGASYESRDLEQVHMLLGFSGVSHHDPRTYAHSVYATLLGGGMSSRLFQEVREKRGLAYSVFAFANAYSDSGLLGVYAGAGEHNAGDCVEVICDELRKVARTLDREEIARARAQLKSSLLMSLESTGARCEQIAQQTLIFGEPLSIREVVAKIEAVDAAAVRRVADGLLAGPPTVAALGPIGRTPGYDAIAAGLR